MKTLLQLGVHAYNTCNVHQPFISIEHHPIGDQTQFSPKDIHRSSRAKSMRINKMITGKEIFDLLSNSPN